jgi:hypothetical protein
MKISFKMGVSNEKRCKNNLKCAIPGELQEIHYRHDFEKNDVNTIKLYHPVKDISKHVFFREN